jgi:DsbC/DsbD-like thiol-disulfide interchange protein
MISSRRPAAILPVFAVVGLLGGAPPAAIAADVTPWDDDLQSAARLISARAQTGTGGPMLRAGLEIRLKPGWKTYWRYPGDSGVPPTFDFSKSENVKSVEVLFPVPRRFPDGAGGHSIGYTGEVILPLHIVPQAVGKPVKLRLHLDYGACEKLCVPAKADLELLLTGGDSSQDAAVRAAETRVPKPAKVGGDGVPSVRAVQRDTGAGKPRVLVDVAAPAGEPLALFAEGPTAQWALPLPEPVAGAPTGLQRFAFALDGLPPGADPSGAQLRLTAIAGDRAVEVAFRLD